MDLLHKQYLLFGGDLYIKDSSPRVSDDVLSLFKNAHTSILNLEAPFVKAARPVSKAGPVIKQGVGAEEVLTHLSVSFVSGANNHLGDHGSQGIVETIEKLKAIGIDSGGYGLNESNAREQYRVPRTNIAIICAAEEEFSVARSERWGTRSLYNHDLIEQISTLKNSGLKVVVYAHGGGEKIPMPSTYIRERFKKFIDSGADAVIAHHPHVLQGYEMYASKPIFYSLGNFAHDVYARSSGCLVAFDLAMQQFKLIPVEYNEHQISIGSIEKFNAAIQSLSAPFNNEHLFTSVVQEQSMYMYRSYYRSYFTGLFVEHLRPIIRLYKLFKQIARIPETHTRKSDTDELMLLHLLRNLSHREFIWTALALMHKEIPDYRDAASAKTFRSLMSLYQ